MLLPAIRFILSCLLLLKSVIDAIIFVDKFIILLTLSITILLSVFVYSLPPVLVL